MLRRLAAWVRGAVHCRHRPHRGSAILFLERLEPRELLAPGDLRIVTYNIASFSGTGAPRSGLATVLEAIGNEVVNGRAQPIDILALQEVQSQATTTQAVVNLLNAIYGDGTYARGTLNGTVAAGGGGTQGVVYRTSSVQLIDEDPITVPGFGRQALRYQFRPTVGGPAAEFYLYNSHFASGGAAADRLSEAQAIRTDADALGNGVPIIYLGDYNVNTANEASYLRLLTSGNGQAFDPISRPGSWLENANFVDVFSQAPLLTPPPPPLPGSDLTGGGLDDRFDQHLLSGELVDGVGLDYVFGSYHAFGNNGSVPVNGNINDPASTALLDLPNRQAVLDALTTASDHLPVVADYTVNARPALAVRWLEPTRTGFTIHFDRAINPADLNLYDAVPSLGASDVTLTGRTSGPITGSLVVAPDNRSVTFIRTGTPESTPAGFLVSDTYTVNMRSASDGFKDTSGGLLDGNGDGTAGDGFTALFSIPPTLAGTVTLSLPDFARGPGQPVAVPAEGAGIPVRLSNGNGITSITLTLRYNPTLLTLTGAAPASGLPAGAMVTLNTSTPGAAVLTFTSPTALAAGARDFAILSAAVPDDSPDGGKHVLDLSDVSINGGAIPVRDDDGVHVVGFFGDTSGNGSYSAVDAQRTLRVAVGLDTGFSAWWLADPMLLADITGNGVLNATDATRILQEVVGLDRPEIPPLPALVPQQGGPDPLLRFPRRLRGHRGETVRVPLLLDPADGLESADLAIAYDGTRLKVVGVRRGRLTKDFDLFAVNVNAEAGTIHTALSRSAGPVRGQGKGSVLEVVFRVKDDALQGPARVNLRASLGAMRTQLNEGGLDLNPDPTDQADDVLDGAIIVNRRSLRRRG